VKAGRFTAVLPEWSKPSATVQAVYLSHRGMLPSLRAFIDYLAKHMRVERRDTEIDPPTAGLEPVAD